MTFACLANEFCTELGQAQPQVVSNKIKQAGRVFVCLIYIPICRTEQGQLASAYTIKSKTIQSNITTSTKYVLTNIATIQGGAKQNCQPGVVLLQENYHHTNTTTCVPLQFRAIQALQCYANCNVQHRTTPYKVTSYTWMQPLHSW